MLADNIRLKNINHITYNVKDKDDWAGFTPTMIVRLARKRNTVPNFNARDRKDGGRFARHDGNIPPTRSPMTDAGRGRYA